MRPDKKVYEAALKMRSPEMAPLLDWLRGEFQETLEKLVTAPKENVPVLQGEGRKLKEILDLVEGAPAALDKKPGLVARLLT